MWSLANSSSAEETKRLMKEDLAGEVTSRSTQRR